MFLDFAIHPSMKTLYYFPKRQADLSVPNNRRNPIFTVPGGGGPINPRGMAALDREPNLITYSFQINPIGDGSILDDEREEFLCAIDHGLPQTLAFRDDHGDHWFATCVLVSDPHKQTAFSNASHAIEASWVILSDYLNSPSAPGASVFGNHIKFGQPPGAGPFGLFGAQGTKVPLTMVQNWFTLDNTGTGATAETTDVVISLKGPFGATDPAIYPIVIACSQSKTSMNVYLALDADDELLIDLAARRVRYNNTPAFGKLRKTEPTDAYYLSLLPDYVNDVVVQLADGATPLATLAGEAYFVWKPKRSL